MVRFLGSSSSGGGGGADEGGGWPLLLSKSSLSGSILILTVVGEYVEAFMVVFSSPLPLARKARSRPCVWGARRGRSLVQESTARALLAAVFFVFLCFNKFSFGGGLWRIEQKSNRRPNTGQILCLVADSEKHGDGLQTGCRCVVAHARDGMTTQSARLSTRVLRFGFASHHSHLD